MGFEVKCIPVLDKMPCCCCSCDLKVATLIMGWLGLFSNVGSFFKYAITLGAIEDSVEEVPNGVEEYVIAGLILSALSLLLLIPLLYGAHTERPAFMLPCIIFDMIGIVAAAAGVAVISVIAFIASALVGFGILIIGGLLIVLCGFFWVVVYSYYRKLEEHQYPGSAACLDSVHTG